MKSKLLIFLVALVGLSSCKAWDPSMMAPPNDPISPKLLTLDRRIDDFANTRVVVSEDHLRLFTQEVETNLMDPFGSKYGYIAMKTNVIEAKMGTAFWFLSFFTAYIPNLFGSPFLVLRYKIEVEYRILDRNNKLLSKYSAIGNSKVIVALYYGYWANDAGRKAYSDCLLDAFNKIRPQVQADAQRINEKLKAAGSF
jgi:hypothetical protein